MAVTIDLFREFQTDHRQIRDLVIDLAQAIGRGDLPNARPMLVRLNRLAGPHFRFEEESLYPALRPFFSDYVDKLYADHDNAIQTARDLVALVHQGAIAPHEAEAGRRKALDLLIHVSDCQGLAIIMERMPQEALDNIVDHMTVARAEALTLLDWADTIRKRRDESLA